MYATIMQYKRGNIMEYILVRSDRDLSLTYEFISYEERQRTQVLKYKGQSYCSLRLNKKTARDYAIMVGWKEITQDYKDWLEEQNTPIEPPKKKTTTRKKTTRKTTTKKK